MKKVFISKNYSDRYTASAKAKYDVEMILEDLHFYNIGLPRLACPNLFLGRIWTVCSNFIAHLRMPKKQLCFLQYPVYGYRKALLNAKKRENTVVTLVHDLNSCRNYGDIPSEIRQLLDSDYIIVHTNMMKDFFLSIYPYIEDKLIVLNIFDYLYQNNIVPPKALEWNAPFRVAFAGNLGKSQFLYDLKYDSNIVWNLFGIGWNTKQNSNTSLFYHGCYPPEELYQHLVSHFGLVWDGCGNSSDSDIHKKYLKLIAPHKLSLYLSAGIPVIVWTKSAIADFVIQNRIGITVPSINHIATHLLKLSAEEYQAMWMNVQIVGAHLRQGYYTKSACQRVCSE